MSSFGNLLPRYWNSKFRGEPFLPPNFDRPLQKVRRRFCPALNSYRSKSEPNLPSLPRKRTLLADKKERTGSDPFSSGGWCGRSLSARPPKIPNINAGAIHRGLRRFLEATEQDISRNKYCIGNTCMAHMTKIQQHLILTWKSFFHYLYLVIRTVLYRTSLSYFFELEKQLKNTFCNYVWNPIRAKIAFRDSAQAACYRFLLPLFFLYDFDALEGKRKEEKRSAGMAKTPFISQSAPPNAHYCYYYYVPLPPSSVWDSERHCSTSKTLAWPGRELNP